MNELNNYVAYAFFEDSDIDHNNKIHAYIKDSDFRKKVLAKYVKNSMDPNIQQLDVTARMNLFESRAQTEDQKNLVLGEKLLSLVAQDRVLVIDIWKNKIPDRLKEEKYNYTKDFIIPAIETVNEEISEKFKTAANIKDVAVKTIVDMFAIGSFILYPLINTPLKNQFGEIDEFLLQNYKISGISEYLKTRKSFSNPLFFNQMLHALKARKYQILTESSPLKIWKFFEKQQSEISTEKEKYHLLTSAVLIISKYLDYKIGSTINVDSIKAWADVLNKRMDIEQYLLFFRKKLGNLEYELKDDKSKHKLFPSDDDHGKYISLLEDDESILYESAEIAFLATLYTQDAGNQKIYVDNTENLVKSLEILTTYKIHELNVYILKLFFGNNITVDSTTYRSRFDKIERFYELIPKNTNQRPLFYDKDTSMFEKISERYWAEYAKTERSFVNYPAQLKLSQNEKMETLIKILPKKFDGASFRYSIINDNNISKFSTDKSQVSVSVPSKTRHLFVHFFYFAKFKVLYALIHVFFNEGNAKSDLSLLTASIYPLPLNYIVKGDEEDIAITKFFNGRIFEKNYYKHKLYGSLELNQSRFLCDVIEDKNNEDGAIRLFFGLLLSIVIENDSNVTLFRFIKFVIFSKIDGNYKDIYKVFINKFAESIVPDRI